MSDFVQNLKTAAAQLNRAVAEKLKIEMTLARPAEHIGSMPDMQGVPDLEDIEAIRLTYENLVADIALGVGTEEGAKAAKGMLEAAKSRLRLSVESTQRAAAINSGLVRKLDVATASVIDAKVAVKRAEGEFIFDQLRKADAEYVEAARQVTLAHKRVLACSVALRVRGLPYPPGGLILVEHFPVGPVSAAASREAHPSAPSGYGENLFPRHDQDADTAALEAEIASRTVDHGGPLARVINALTKAPLKAA